MNPHPLLLKAIGLALNMWALVQPRRAAGEVYRVFTRPPRPRLRPKELAFLKTGVRRDTQHAGRPVVEYHWGTEGPPIYLAYGWGYNAGRWRHFVPRLVEAGYRVIAYDPPGHGQAPREQLNLVKNAEIIRSLIQTYGAPHALIGHSFGGAASVLALAGLAPARHPVRMVIMASFSDAMQVFRKFQQTLGLHELLFWRFVRHMEARAGASMAAFDLARLSGQHLERVPALIVHDPEDQVTPFGHARRYHAYWPGSLLYAVSGAGHHLGHAPVTESILRFVIRGQRPAEATVQEHALPAGHDLVRFFAGLED
jgi:pimeloyl-ACP methyl ester carboxylesterase